MSMRPWQGATESDESFARRLEISNMTKGLKWGVEERFKQVRTPLGQWLRSTRM